MKAILKLFENKYFRIATVIIILLLILAPRFSHYYLIDKNDMRDIRNSPHRFINKEDFLRFLSSSFPQPFTNRILSESVKVSLRLTGKTTYSLRKMGLIKQVGKYDKSSLFDLNWRRLIQKMFIDRLEMLLIWGDYVCSVAYLV